MAHDFTGVNPAMQAFFPAPMKESKQVPQSVIDCVGEFLGKDNIRWFYWVKRLKGSINCVLKLNFKRKFIPVHPIHLREGMQIRNFMRLLPECKEWTDHDFDDNWVLVIEVLINQWEKKLWKE